MANSPTLNIEIETYKEAADIYRLLRDKQQTPANAPLSGRIQELYEKFERFGDRWSENVTPEVAGISAYIIAIHDMGTASKSREANWTQK